MACEEWLPIGTAADAAGVARRTAFRWVRASLVPVRPLGRRRCIEVGALRRVAAERQCATGTALNHATAAHPDETNAPPLPSFEPDAVVALSESVANVEELLNSLAIRFGAIERALGLR